MNYDEMKEYLKDTINTKHKHNNKKLYKLARAYELQLEKWKIVKDFCDDVKTIIHEKNILDAYEKKYIHHYYMYFMKK